MADAVAVELRHTFAVQPGDRVGLAALVFGVCVAVVRCGLLDHGRWFAPFAGAAASRPGGLGARSAPPTAKGMDGPLDASAKPDQAVVAHVAAAAAGAAPREFADVDSLGARGQSNRDEVHRPYHGAWGDGADVGGARTGIQLSFESAPATIDHLGEA